MTTASIYLDHNATSGLDPEVFEAMRPFLVGLTGNASSRHSFGRQARRAIEAARNRIRDSLAADSAEVVFTSSATEANNLAIFTVRPGAYVLLNPTEHPSALEPALLLRRRGCIVEECHVDSAGGCSAPRFSEDGRPFELAIVQLANSETGAVQDVAYLAAVLAGVRLHCDAVQAVGRIKVDFSSLGVASMTISGHKLHGPAGVGALVHLRDSSLQPLIHGGRQQSGLRAGTEPVALIVGLGVAVEKAVRRQAEDGARTASLRDRLEAVLLAGIPGSSVNGPTEKARRLPNTLNVSFPDVPAQAMVMALDLAGVCCSAGSACASGSMLPSHVLQAMGVAGRRLLGAVRFSVGRFTTDEEIDRAGRVILATYKAVGRRLGEKAD